MSFYKIYFYVETFKSLCLTIFGFKKTIMLQQCTDTFTSIQMYGYLYIPFSVYVPTSVPVAVPVPASVPVPVLTCSCISMRNEWEYCKSYVYTNQNNCLPIFLLVR